MTRRTHCITLLTLALVLVPAVARADATGATIDKTGWWNRANMTTPTPAGPVAAPPPPGIPEGDLVVGALRGEPSAVLAIGVQPDEAPGATVESFTLQVTEDPEAESNQGTAGAAILACPITDFWAGGPNGDWETRPSVDCAAASAAGTRDDNGVWTFDLTPIARVWFDPFGTIRADGVVLQPDLENTDPFQAVFQGGDAIEIDLQAEPGPAEEDPFASPGIEDPPADAGFNTGGSGDTGSIISPPVVTAPPSPTFDSPSSDPLASPETEPAPIETGSDADVDETAAPTVVDSPATEPAASRAGDLVGNLSPLVFFGILAFVGMLGVMSYWLGPAGQPVTTIRQRGVSRVLEARADVTKGS